MTNQPTTTEPQDAADTGYAPARWAFDAEVSRVFDDMLDRSIPDLAAMRRIVYALGAPLVQFGTDVVDLGCSRGGALAPFITHFGAQCHYVGVEVSEPMREAARERFAALSRQGVVRIEDTDLRTGYPRVRASLTLAVLTLMFVPIEHRQRVVADAFRTTQPGGALIVVEKLLGSDARINDALVAAYEQHKEANGYSREDIARKRLALEGVLVPVTAAWNESMLRSAGFAHVEPVWRSLNFGAWLAIKD